MPIGWAALEVLLGNKSIIEYSDVWSFGVFMWEMFHLGSAEPYGDKKDMIDVKRLVNLINIFTGSPSWNSHHHGQTQEGE